MSTLPALERGQAVASAALRAVLCEQRGEQFADFVDGLRDAAEALRRGEPGAAENLTDWIGQMDSRGLTPAIRACTLELHLANLSEERERVRRRRAYDRGDGPPQRESLADTAGRLADVPRSAVEEALEGLCVDLVLTAHPTEAMRRSILDHQRRVSSLLDVLDDDRIGDSERSRTEDELREALTLWWQTESVRRRRPEVEDEVQNTLFFLAHVLYDVVPILLTELQRCFGWRPVGWTPVRFGSWAGGDMDGNPSAGAATLRKALELHRRTALELLADHVHQLAGRFSQASDLIEPSAELAESLERDSEELGGLEAERRQHEPLRRKLGFVERRLRRMAAGEPGYAHPRDLLADLERVRESSASGRVASGEILSLATQVESFGFHLAKLDARQSAEKLRAAAVALLPEFEAADEDRRQQILTEAIAQPEPGPADVPEEVSWVLEAFDALATSLAEVGPEALDTLIISMAQQPSDVLCALWLARRAGTTQLRITPLFETIPDLERSQATMDALYANQAYADHLAGLGNAQEVMLGYSDSCKDSGYLASQWGLYRVQERLLAQADAHEVSLRFFHGRGGSPSRGGGPSYRAILSQPPGSVRGRLRITEQGEVIAAKYPHPQLGLRSLEQTVSAVLLASASPAEQPDGRYCEEMERLAQRSREVYRELVYDDPDFATFFRQVTPIEELSQLNIGSRPSSRGASDGISELRAIPWVFAWTQNRLLLTSWYGAGTALAEGDPELQREMWESWPFFRATLATLEFALFKSDLGVAERYRRLADPALADRLWPTIVSEHERLVEQVLAVSRFERLLDGAPTLQERLEQRNPWMDPLSHLQVELLTRLRAGDEAARGPLLASVNGIAAGMRNTG